MRALTVGIVPPIGGGVAALRDSLAAMEREGIDRVVLGDHVSFHDGRGFDGLIYAAAVAAASDLEIATGVYLLPLRHPVLVARQLASIAELAPGQFVFGIGIGGEDPHEVAICGVDQRTRGRRTDESLAIIRALLAGDEVTHHSELFDIDAALIRPVPAEPVPIHVGGRSPAALRRAARYSEGLLGIFSSVRRYREAIATVEAQAAELGRTDVDWRHGYQLWCGFDTSVEAARSRLAPTVEEMYKLPFDLFDRYTAYGTPEDVAATLAPYVEAGCRCLNLMSVSPSPAESVAYAAEMARLLKQH